VIGREPHVTAGLLKPCVSRDQRQVRSSRRLDDASRDFFERLGLAGRPASDHKTTVFHRAQRQALPAACTPVLGLLREARVVGFEWVAIDVWRSGRRWAVTRCCRSVHC